MKRKLIGFHYSVYVAAKNDHVITNVAGNKTLCLKKTNLPDTGMLHTKLLFLCDIRSILSAI